MRSSSARGITDGAGDDGRRSDHGGGPDNGAGAMVEASLRLRRAPCPDRGSFLGPEEYVRFHTELGPSKKFFTTARERGTQPRKSILAGGMYTLQGRRCKSSLCLRIGCHTVHHVPILDAPAVPDFHQDHHHHQEERSKCDESRHFGSEFSDRINFPSRRRALFYLCQRRKDKEGEVK